MGRKRPLDARVRQARATLAARTTPLPAVLTRREGIELFGRHFVQLAHYGVVPGARLGPDNTWRCDRDTFVAWLDRVSGGTADDKERHDATERYNANHLTGADPAGTGALASGPSEHHPQLDRTGLPPEAA